MTMSAERPRLVPFLLAAAVACVPSLVCGQTLQELYEVARGYDAAYLAVRSQVESVPYNVAQTEALMRPNASLSGTAARNETKLPTSDVNRPGSTTTLSVNAGQPLFNRANSVTIEQARKSLDVAQYNLLTAEQSLILRVAQAYFDVLAAQDVLAASRASKAAITEQLASAKRNFEVGTATITDTREAQARFDLATAQELIAENDLRFRRIALDQLVGRPNVEPRPLAVPLTLPPLDPPSLDEWVARADAEHPDVQRARLALDIATLDVTRARAGHLPTVTANASLANTHNNGGASTFPGTTRQASLGVTLNLPLFSGFSVQNQIRERLLIEDQRRSELDAARRNVVQATRQAFFNLQSVQGQAKAYEAAEASSQLALDATQLGYRVGVRVNVDVLNAQSQLYSTRQTLARARYDVLLNDLRLRQASGRLLPQDVAALNQLLAR